jgi:hypothetical protein
MAYTPKVQAHNTNKIDPIAPSSAANPQSTEKFAPGN